MCGLIDVIASLIDGVSRMLAYIHGYSDEPLVLVPYTS